MQEQKRQATKTQNAKNPIFIKTSNKFIYILVTVFAKTFTKVLSATPQRINYFSAPSASSAPLRDALLPLKLTE
jgi:hypothetical protein